MFTAINAAFTHHSEFIIIYKYTPPWPLGEIEAGFKTIEKEIADMLGEVTE